MNIEKATVGISIVRAFVVAGSLLLGGWYLGGYMNGLTSRIDSLERSVSQLSSDVNKLTERVAFR